MIRSNVGATVTPSRTAPTRRSVSDMSPKRTIEPTRATWALDGWQRAASDWAAAARA